MLIGSRAINYWEPAFKVSDTTDWDVISTKPIEHCEWHRPDILNNSDMLDYAVWDSEVVLPNGETAKVCSPVGLAIIKRSHLWRDLGFGKHITQYHKHLKQYIFAYTETDTKVLQQRIDMTLKSYPQRGPNLMQTPKDFFDDAVTKIYDHDYLHTLVAYYDAPLYTRLLRSDDLVWCDKDKWDTFTHEDQLKCVAEETYVIAIERFMVPSNWEAVPKLSYAKALQKVCTTLCKGWFRDKAIDFYPEVLRMYSESKIYGVKQTLENLK